MAGRKRDYRAEEARRNELARERGYRSRAQQRRAVERGETPALRPKALRNPGTIAKQKFLLGSNTRGIEKRNTVLPRFGSQFSDSDRAQDWSDIYARSDVARYDPDNRPSGMSKREYTDAYLAAFVDGPERYVQVRRAGGSEALRHWLVDIKGYMQADEYESRYGRLVK